jgi:hypothetical protein
MAGIQYTQKMFTSSFRDSSFPMVVGWSVVAVASVWTVILVRKVSGEKRSGRSSQVRRAGAAMVK